MWLVVAVFVILLWTLLLVLWCHSTLKIVVLLLNMPRGEALHRRLVLGRGRPPCVMFCAFAAGVSPALMQLNVHPAEGHTKAEQIRALCGENTPAGNMYVPKPGSLQLDQILNIAISSAGSSHTGCFDVNTKLRNYALTKPPTQTSFRLLTAK